MDGLANDVLISNYSANQTKKKGIEFIADPFLLKNDGLYYVIFEYLNSWKGNGEIGYAESTNLIDWSYKGTILKKPYHISYPYIIKSENHYYMVPETSANNDIQIYKAVSFPSKWKYLMKLMEGKPFKDTSIFYYDQYWWMFTTYDNKNLHLYYSSKLLSDRWTKHPQSPVLSGRYARPGGSILFYKNKILRFSQDSVPNYGTKLVAFEIKELNAKKYCEHIYSERYPFLNPGGSGWNSERMHHIDFLLDGNKLYAAVDGYSNEKDNRILILLMRAIRFLRRKINI